MKLLNLGCGSTFHSDWINVDFVKTGPDVIAHNLLTGIPLPEHSIDVIYHSHLLEHLVKEDAGEFIAQCYNVLKPCGTLRVVVPDLERMVRCYLEKLEDCESGKCAEEKNYDWMMLELYDQTVRNSAGGEMSHFLTNLGEKDRIFVRSRIGIEAEGFWEPKQILTSGHRLNTLINKRPWGRLIKLSRVKLASLLVYLIAGKAAYGSFSKGVFRDSGEVHQWMYDRYSLKRLLVQAGFVNVKICAANESRIPEFNKYSLDVLNGIVRKPDSLYVEASKP